MDIEKYKGTFYLHRSQRQSKLDELQYIISTQSLCLTKNKYWWLRFLETNALTIMLVYFKLLKYLREILNWMN